MHHIIPQIRGEQTLVDLSQKRKENQRDQHNPTEKEPQTLPLMMSQQSLEVLCVETSAKVYTFTSLPISLLPIALAPLELDKTWNRWIQRRGEEGAVGR